MENIFMETIFMGCSLMKYGKNHPTVGDTPMTMETPTCLNQIILIIIILIEIVSPVHASLVNYPQSTLLIAPPCSQESCPKRQILPPQVPRGREVIPVGGRKKVTRKTKVSELGVPPIDPNSWWLCTGKSH